MASLRRRWPCTPVTTLRATVEPVAGDRERRGHGLIGIDVGMQHALAAEPPADADAPEHCLRRVGGPRTELSSGGANDDRAIGASCVTTACTHW